MATFVLHANTPCAGKGNVSTLSGPNHSIAVSVAGVGAVFAQFQVWGREDGGEHGKINGLVTVSGTTSATQTVTFTGRYKEIWLELVGISAASTFSATITTLETEFATKAELDAAVAANGGQSLGPSVSVAGVLWVWNGNGYFRPFDCAAPGTGKYLVRWLDYKGNIIAQQWANAGETLPSPIAPTFAGLTFSSWAGSSALITSHIDIVGVWAPTDGKAHVFVDASALVGLKPTLKVDKSDTSTMLVEWGDGTTSTTSASGNVTIVKNSDYAPGSYEIKMSITSGSGTFTAGHGTTGNQMLAGVAVTEIWFHASTVSIPAYALNGTAFSTLAYVTGLANCTSFGAYAVQYCYSLASLALPACTSFGASAAQSCTSLASLALPACTSFGASAAQSCTSLASLALPACTSFGAYAVQYCRTLRTVVLGAGVTSLAALCLDSAPNLISIRIEATTPPTLASAVSIAGYDPRMMISVPAASVDAYKTATNWSAFADRIVRY